MRSLPLPSSAKASSSQTRTTGGIQLFHEYNDTYEFEHAK
jgi:hypothetical protein